MKPHFFAICIIGTILYTNKLNADTFSPDGTENCLSSTTVSFTHPCPADSAGRKCIVYGDNITGVTSCTSCPSGYTLKTKTLLDCCTEYSYGVCIGNCSSTCGDNTTEWSKVKAGYETRIYEYCSGATTCTQKTQYRCAAGYYGGTSDGTSGCTICPGALLGATSIPSPGGIKFISTFITGCHFPAYTPFTDDSGTYQYTEKCQYKQDLQVIL